jgi:hypothetical protein
MMTKKIFFLLLIIISNSFFGQTTRKIVKDFDGDLKNDTVRIDSDSKKLICLLSTQKFKKVESGEIQRLNFGNTLLSTKKGFEFWNDFDRSGFKCVFIYNQKAKKMQLIQMRRVDDILSYDFGEKSKGLSTVNLITNKYVGNFYQLYHKKLLKMPTINAEMIFPKTYLETFSDILCFDYESKCLVLYEKNKKK